MDLRFDLLMSISVAERIRGGGALGLALRARCGWGCKWKAGWGRWGSQEGSRRSSMLFWRVGGYLKRKSSLDKTFVGKLKLTLQIKHFTTTVVNIALYVYCGVRIPKIILLKSNRIKSIAVNAKKYRTVFTTYNSCIT